MANLVSTDPNINPYAENIVGNSTFSFGGGSTGGTGATGSWGTPITTSTTGGTTGTTTTDANLPLESMPEGPDMSWIDEAVNAGKAALDQFTGVAQDLYSTAVNEATVGGEQQKTEAQGEETRRLGALGQQRTREEGRASSAVSEAKRIASEMIQGNMARFGGSTGSGGFTEAILGSEAMRNVGNVRSALQNTMGQIAQAEEDVRSRTTEIINAVNQNTEMAKERARNELNQALASIASKRAELESTKAEMKMAALENYQQLISDINARNTAFKQQLYMKTQEVSSQLTSFQNSALEQFYTAIGQPMYSQVNVGGTAYQPIPSNVKGTTYDFLASKGTEEDELGLPQQLR